MPINDARRAAFASFSHSSPMAAPNVSISTAVSCMGSTSASCDKIFAMPPFSRSAAPRAMVLLRFLNAFFNGPSPPSPLILRNARRCSSSTCSVFAFRSFRFSKVSLNLRCSSAEAAFCLVMESRLSRLWSPAPGVNMDLLRTSLADPIEFRRTMPAVLRRSTGLPAWRAGAFLRSKPGAFVTSCSSSLRPEDEPVDSELS
mmetsp:Transcript_105829/g.187352  ORF Transcript_105829/g.187352 Transcript_105829/m.187352 type:complete len:201 (-) Transcript_105829:277-879(-)